MQTVNIALKLPVELSRDIDRKLIDLAEIGVKITKADFCTQLIQLGLKGGRNDF
jgi:hypothetical protein